MHVHEMMAPRRFGLLHANQRVDPDVAGGKTWFREPGQYTGLAGKLRSQGWDLVVIDYDPATVNLRELWDEVKRQDVEVLGVGFFSEPTQALHSQVMMLSAKDAGITTIVGRLGNEAEEQVARELYDADIYVRGEGEDVIASLASRDFIQRGTFHSSKRVQIDDLSFRRPWENKYAIIVLDIVRGCPWSCGYCGNYLNSTLYPSEKWLRNYLAYIRDLRGPGTGRFDLAAAEFTAKVKPAAMAAQVLSEYDEGQSFIMFGSVLATRALLGDRARAQVWSRLAGRHEVHEEVGYESGIPGRLMRLGKTKTERQAREHVRNLLKIIRRAHGMDNFRVGLDWMLFDPQSTPEEMYCDMLLAEEILAFGTSKVSLSPQLVFNHLIVMPGTDLWNGPYGNYSEWVLDGGFFQAFREFTRKLERSNAGDLYTEAEIFKPKDVPTMLAEARKFIVGYHGVKGSAIRAGAERMFDEIWQEATRPQ
ncbi:MAG: hypothetical protein ABH823_01245 [bacterium]